jgi:hypothetical protein
LELVIVESFQWAQTDSSSAFTWAQSLSDATSREAVVPGIVSALAEQDPKSAALLISQLSSDTQVIAASSLISQWASSDPQAASIWAASLPQGEMRDQLFANLASSWAKSDSSRAGEWLNTLTNDPSRDAAVSAFATHTTSVDPQLALQWAATITDPAAREGEIKAAIESWFEVDPEKAGAWLASSGLPDEVKIRFLPSHG